MAMGPLNEKEQVVKNDRNIKARTGLIAGSAAILLAFASSVVAGDASFKANFNLQAASATVSQGQLTLSGVSPVVFVLESEPQSAYGVTESTTFFLERWHMLEHSIRPQGILFTSSGPQDSAYRSLRFDIDNPARSDDGSADWVFDISHIDGAIEKFEQARLIEPVMLTIVMEHTQEEVAAGRICGPWDISNLAQHHELFE
jgi:hypothetical protein